MKLEFIASKMAKVGEILEESGVTRKVRRSLKKGDYIFVDEKLAMINSLVNVGQKITVLVEETESDIERLKMDLDIVYEDLEYLVINKPNGLYVMTNKFISDAQLINGIAYYFHEHEIKSKVHLVNRLDKETSGLLLVAKNRLAKDYFSNNIEKRVLRKYYVIIEGFLDNEEGIIELPIRKSSDSIKREVNESGSYALTKYRVIKKVDKYSLLEVVLHTGRTHQIRVHFAYLGHPIVGDSLYNENSPVKELMLHSFFIEFTNPFTNKCVTYKTPLPERFKKLLGE